MKDLGDISEHKRKPFGRAFLLFDAEEEHAHAVLQFKGYLHLSDAFKCLFLETVEAVNRDIRPNIKQPLSEFYGLFVPRLAQSFVALCGAERVAINGYPYQGYTLLRNIFDNVVLTSAALQRVTDFYSIEGVNPNAAYSPDDTKKLRKSTELKAREQMTGSACGLPPHTIAELKNWDAMFDLEVHGARLSATHSMPWMKGHGGLAVLPKYDERAFALFANRYMEVSWMLHRLFPNLQPDQVALSKEWGDGWRTIDECFEQTVVSLTHDMGKPIGAAIVEFVHAKFPFSERSAFPL